MGVGVQFKTKDGMLVHVCMLDILEAGKPSNMLCSGIQMQNPESKFLYTETIKLYCKYKMNSTA